MFATLPMKRYRDDHGDMGVSLQAWHVGRHEILELVRQEHVKSPEDQGPTRERLRKLSARRWSPSAFNLILSDLIGVGELCCRGLSIHLPGHEARMLAADIVLWTRISPLLAAKPYAPPRVDQIARQLGTTEKSVRSVLTRATQSGEGYMVGEDRFYPLRVLHDIADRLKLHASDGMDRKGVSAAMMRDVLGIGRNIVIEILEFFDRVGYTRRVGDLHFLRRENSDLFDRR